MSSYFDYLQNVLGIESFLFTESFVESMTGSLASNLDLVIPEGSKLVFLAFDSTYSHPMSSQHRVMVDRMIQAMKFEIHEVVRIENQSQQISDEQTFSAQVQRVLESENCPQFFVVFGEKAKQVLTALMPHDGSGDFFVGQIYRAGTIKWIPTLDLTEISTSQENKKEVWKHLQSVVRELAQ